MGTGRESIPRLFVCAQEMKVRIGRCRNASSTSIHQHQPRPPTQFLHHFSPNIFFWPNFSTFSSSSTPFSPTLHLLFIHIVPFFPNQHLFLKPSRTKWGKWGDGWVKCPAPTWPTNPTTQGPTEPHFIIKSTSIFLPFLAGKRRNNFLEFGNSNRKAEVWMETSPKPQRTRGLSSYQLSQVQTQILIKFHFQNLA